MNLERLVPGDDDEPIAGSPSEAERKFNTNMAAIEANAAAVEVALTDRPHEVAVYRQGTPGNAEVMLRYVFARAVEWPEDLAGSQLVAGTASTGDVSCSLEKNGDEVGTVRYNASAAGVATVAGGVSWEAGDVLTVKAPSAADATLADVSMTIAGTR